MTRTFTEEDRQAAQRFREKAKGWELPLLMADVVLMTLEEGELRVLLMRRGEAPERGRWALPGAFAIPGVDGSMEETALRGLREKTDVRAPYLEQLMTFSGPDRDPRGWSSSNAYMCLVPRERLSIQAGHGASEARLMSLKEAMALPLAFDHNEILAKGMERLRGKGSYSSLAGHLLPEKFTLSELQKVYEVILERKLNKSAFRKKIQEAGFTKPCEGEMKTGANRPAQLYQLANAAGLSLLRRTLAPTA